MYLQEKSFQGRECTTAQNKISKYGRLKGKQSILNLI